MSKNFITKLLPNKMTAAQRSAYKTAKLKTTTGKVALKEAGKTIRSAVSNIATNRTIQQKIAADAMKSARGISKVENDRINDAISLYEEIIKGNPEAKGESGNESTTNVGSSGSAIGG